jgi:hypothetical protein
VTRKAGFNLHFSFQENSKLSDEGDLPDISYSSVLNTLKQTLKTVFNVVDENLLTNSSLKKHKKFPWEMVIV